MKMIGKTHNAGRCSFGCCREHPDKTSERRMIKRRERQTWKKEETR